MFYSLFKLFRAYRKGKTKDGMSEFANEQAGDLLLAPFWIAILIIAPFFIASAVFAFFEVLGGPYGIAKFFFWLFIAVIAVIILIMRAIISKTKKIVQKTGDKITN